MTEENVQEIEETNNKIDLLNRQPFVQKIIKVCELLSKNKKNACFAINGQWGIGKSFVLEMFEKQIAQIQNEDTATNQYFLFHYNCWNYDYYDEPIVAIVSSMLDEIDEKEHLLNADQKVQVKAILKIIGKNLLDKGNDTIKEKTGIDLNKLVDEFKNGKEDISAKIEKNNEYDDYFNFKKVLNSLKETIKQLAQDKTVLIVVDELDRCLPEYTIKVLERLHHVFDEIPNVQVIISMDKSQLAHTVKQIYGDTDVEKYLAKFIDFELDLDEGILTDDEIFEIRFNDYLNKFDVLLESTHQVDINQFIDYIFRGFGIRDKIAIINKCQLLHNLLNQNDEKIDKVYMCIELLLIVVKYINPVITTSATKTIEGNLFYPRTENESITFGLELFNKKYIDSCNICTVDNRTVVSMQNIWGVLLATCRYVRKQNDIYEYASFDIPSFKRYIDNFLDLLQTIN